MQRNTEECEGIRGNTGNTEEYEGIQRNTREYEGIRGIQRNTREYEGRLEPGGGGLVRRHAMPDNRQPLILVHWN